jgi:hypothetical protein
VGGVLGGFSPGRNSPPVLGLDPRRQGRRHRRLEPVRALFLTASSTPPSRHGKADLIYVVANEETWMRA